MLLSLLKHTSSDLHPVGKPIKKAKVHYDTGTPKQPVRRMTYQVEPTALRDKDSDGTGLTITAAVNDKTATLPVVDSTVFNIGDYIEINNEVMKVKTKPDGDIYYCTPWTKCYKLNLVMRVVQL